MNITKVNIFSNDNELSIRTKKKLIKKINETNLELNEQNFDLAIAIGGDGSFIRMLRACQYNTDLYYVGINCGTLGFLQNINPDEIDDFINRLITTDYKVDEVSIQETKVFSDNQVISFNSLNEVLIRESKLDSLPLDVKIDNNLLETYNGDGLLISTSVGSSAYNLSFGGSIVYNNFHTMQLTPIAPIKNREYKNLLNSLIIPSHLVIELITRNKKNILFTSDGINEQIDNVDKIRISILDKKIKCLRFNDYHFIKTVNEKFLK